MHLPAEILLEIFQLVEKKDLKRIRLASQELSVCASKHLFDTVYISAHHEDYYVLNAIARHPSLSQYARFLRYDASQFPTTISKTRYLRDLSLQLWQLFTSRDSFPLECHNRIANDIADYVQPSNRRDWSSIQDKIWQKYSSCNFVEEGYRTFLMYAERQYDVLCDGAYWKRVGQCIGRFPRLESAEIYDEWCDEMKTDWCKQSDVDKISRYGDVLYRGSPLARSWNVLFLRPFHWSHSRGLGVTPLTSNGSQDFAILHSLLYSVPQRIRQLKTGDRGQSASLSSAIMHPDGVICASQRMNHCWPYAALEDLFLRIDENDWSLSDSFCPLTGLQTLLYSASGLRRLYLRLPSYNGADSRAYTIEQVFPSHAAKWPRLKSFEITNLCVDAIGLMALLQFDMPALRSLKFSRVKLSDYSWEEVIEAMRMTLNLSTFDVSMIWALQYPDDRVIWSAEIHVMNRDDIWISTDDHKTFSKSIETYVVQGGQHPFLDTEGSSETLVESARRITSAALALTEVKRSPQPKD